MEVWEFVVFFIFLVVTGKPQLSLSTLNFGGTACDHEHFQGMRSTDLQDHSLISMNKTVVQIPPT